MAYGEWNWAGTEYILELQNFIGEDPKLEGFICLLKDFISTLEGRDI